MQSLKKIHAWAQMKVPLYLLYSIADELYNFLCLIQLISHLTKLLNAHYYTGVTNHRCTNCLRQALKQTILQKPINYILLN